MGLYQVTNTGLAHKRTKPLYSFILPQSGRQRDKETRTMAPADGDISHGRRSEYHRTCRLDTESAHSVVQCIGTPLETNLNR